MVNGMEDIYPHQKTKTKNISHNVNVKHNQLKQNKIKNHQNKKTINAN